MSEGTAKKAKVEPTAATAVEEDDEFEEFPAESNTSLSPVNLIECCFPHAPLHARCVHCLKAQVNSPASALSLTSDTAWDSADEDKQDVEQWEENWDDESLEDDFSQQLR